MKRARNVAMPEVLAETIAQRAYHEKATWILEDPLNAPFDESYVGFSPISAAALATFKRVTLHRVAGLTGASTVAPAARAPLRTSLSSFSGNAAPQAPIKKAVVPRNQTKGE